ncbi:replication protein RepA [Granulicella sibirica]|uniref:Plasmid encoded RepA protein n=1 Tax=Granulicella sibirica TaxID=2479048 RepID=A0A4Q0SUR3_9BACT|nr:replication protein RepA [Granulicella sibirica]RXH54062.1 plasmid encoded RepA protein [Granulicella sibirica]
MTKPEARELMTISEFRENDMGVLVLAGTRKRVAVRADAEGRFVPVDQELVVHSNPPQKPKRDHKAEVISARSSRAMKSAETRIALQSDETDVMQLAQALIMCGLPYSRTAERQVSRKARLGDGSTVTVTFTAQDASTDMPFGSDRLLLHYLLDKAVKSGSRYVSWDTAKQFMTDLGMTGTGGKAYADLRHRFDRLRALGIFVSRKGAGRNDTANMSAFSSTRLPSSMDLNAENVGQELLPLPNKSKYGIEIGEGLFNDLIKHHVPVPTELLIQTRGNAQLQDICTFLYWRCFSANSPSVIPWESIREQLGSSDSNPRRIKQRFADAIKFFIQIWPELNAEVTKAGLKVAPPTGGTYLLRQGKAARRIG